MNPNQLPPLAPIYVSGYDLRRRRFHQRYWGRVTIVHDPSQLEPRWEVEVEGEMLPEMDPGEGNVNELKTLERLAQTAHLKIEEGQADLHYAREMLKNLEEEHRGEQLDEVEENYPEDDLEEQPQGEEERDDLHDEKEATSAAPTIKTNRMESEDWIAVSPSYTRADGTATAPRWVKRPMHEEAPQEGRSTRRRLM